jgi:membrane-associated phospholipid phosphatase
MRLREGPTPSRHGPVAQLLIALAPLSLILIAYAVAQWITTPLAARGDSTGTNRLGLGLHVTGPADVDRRIFGAIPSVWLQERLVDGAAHWYDAVAALVYSTHFVAIPLVTAVAWFCLRERFTAWIAAVLAFTTLGIGVYVVYPAAPPWMASERGEIGVVDRISSPGWDYLHLDVIGRLIVSGQEGSNPVAAMPSLHAGSAMLVALFLWPLVTSLWRTALLIYVLLMALALVYTGEHYVVDVVAGWLTAGAAVAVAAAVRRRRPRPPSAEDTVAPEPLSASSRPV